MMPFHLNTGCEVCGSQESVWETMPGAGGVRVCLAHRREWSKLLVNTYPGLYIEMNTATARFRRMMSGLPFASGIYEDEQVAREFLEVEKQVLVLWENFVDDQRSAIEEAKYKKEGPKK